MVEYIRFFKTLSDWTRLRIIRLLLNAKSSLCVCEIVDSLGESQYKVSRHLKDLKNAGFIIKEKEGRWVHYSLLRPESEFHDLILQTVAAVPEEHFVQERKRLKKRLSLRKNGKCVAGVRSDEYYKL